MLPCDNPSKTKANQLLENRKWGLLLREEKERKKKKSFGFFNSSSFPTLFGHSLNTSLHARPQMVRRTFATVLFSEGNTTTADKHNDHNTTGLQEDEFERAHASLGPSSD